jgi:hypothetical protein
MRVTRRVCAHGGKGHKNRNDNGMTRRMWSCSFGGETRLKPPMSRAHTIALISTAPKSPIYKSGILFFGDDGERERNVIPLNRCSANESSVSKYFLFVKKPIATLR